MNREQLRYFSVAYRTHNFAAAARAIPMSAQGFVKSIRALESELGVPLFERDENGANAPTPYADVLAGFSKTFERDYRRLMRDFESIKAEQGNEVVVGSSLGIMGLLGNRFIEELSRELPNLRFSYSEMSDRLCDEGLKDGAYNVAFTIAPFDMEFTTHTAYTTPVCLWIRADDPLSGRNVIRPIDLDGRAIAMPGRDFKCHHTILEACRSAGASPASIMESSEMFWLFDFVLKEGGISFSAGHLGELSFFESVKNVRCIPLEGIMWTFGISTLAKHALTGAERQFHGFCKRYFGKMPQRT